MTELGGRADPLKLDRRTVAVRKEGIAHDNRAALGSWARALDHDEVSLDAAVVDKAADRVDALVCKIELRCAAPGVLRCVDHKDLLVGVRAVEVTHLTGAGDSILDVGRVPGTDAGNFAVSAAGLTRKTGDAPAGDDAFEPTAARDGDGVDLRSHAEDVLDRDRLLHEGVRIVDLLGHTRSAVDLDFHDVGLLLLQGRQGGLGVGDDADDVSVLLKAPKLLLDVCAVGGLLHVGREGRLLRVEVVAVEATHGGLGNVGGPDGRHGAEALRGLGVPDDGRADHRRGVDDCRLVDGLAVVEVRAAVVDEAHDVRAAGLVAEEGREVDGRALDVWREGLAAPAAARAALAGEVAEVALAAARELAVGHRGPCLFRSENEFKLVGHTDTPVSRLHARARTFGRVVKA